MHLENIKEIDTYRLVSMLSSGMEFQDISRHMQMDFNEVLQISSILLED